MLMFCALYARETRVKGAWGEFIGTTTNTAVKKAELGRENCRKTGPREMGKNSPRRKRDRKKQTETTFFPFYFRGDQTGKARGVMF